MLVEAPFLSEILTTLKMPSFPGEQNGKMRSSSYNINHNQCLRYVA